MTGTMTDLDATDVGHIPEVNLLTFVLGLLHWKVWISSGCLVYPSEKKRQQYIAVNRVWM